jgi:hypothetical protein
MSCRNSDILGPTLTRVNLHRLLISKCLASVALRPAALPFPPTMQVWDKHFWGASISGPSGRIRRSITAPLFGVADCDVRQKNAPTGNVCRGKALMRHLSGTKKGIPETLCPCCTDFSDRRHFLRRKAARGHLRSLTAQQSGRLKRPP